VLYAVKHQHTSLFHRKLPAQPEWEQVSCLSPIYSTTTAALSMELPAGLR